MWVLFFFSRWAWAFPPPPEEAGLVTASFRAFPPRGGGLRICFALGAGLLLSPEEHELVTSSCPGFSSMGSSCFFFALGVGLPPSPEDRKLVTSSSPGFSNMGPHFFSRWAWAFPPPPEEAGLVTAIFRAFPPRGVGLRIFVRAWGGPPPLPRRTRTSYL